MIGALLRVPAAAVYAGGGLFVILGTAYGCGAGTVIYLATGVLCGGVALNTAADLLTDRPRWPSRLIQAAAVVVWLPVVLVVLGEGDRVGLRGVLFLVAASLLLALLLGFASLPHWWSADRSWSAIGVLLVAGLGMFAAGLTVTPCASSH